MVEIAEVERLEALRRYAVVDTGPEAVFDDLTRLAAQVCEAPMALISLVDSDRQWFKSHLGLEVCSTSREVSFCAHTLHTGRLLVVPDATLDPRFADNPFVIDDPWVRFYAGAPLIDDEGHVLGTLCVLDTRPRLLTPVQSEQLSALARQAMAQLTLRRQSQELAESRRLLDSILEHSSAAVYAKDLDGRYILGNPAFRDAVGRGEDILGRSDYDLFPSLVADQLRANDRAVVSGEVAHSFTEHLPSASGPVRDYRSVKFPLVDGDGTVHAVAGVSTDVSDLVEERRLHGEAEQRWRALVDASPVSVSIIDTTGRYVWANELARELYGVGGPVGLAGRDAMDFAAPEAAAQTRRLFLDVLAGRTIRGVEWRLLRGDGQVIDVVVNAAPVAYDGRQAVMIQLSDITSRVAEIRGLAESERSWRALFDASPVGIGLSDEHGRFVAANAALLTLFGRTSAEVIGHSSAEFTYADDLETHSRAAELIEDAEDGVLRLEKRYVRPDGQVRWAWLTIRHTTGPAGQTWTLAHVQDVTERKAAERATADSEANLRAVADVVAHMQTGSDPRQTIVEAAVQLAEAAYSSIIEPTEDRGRLRVTSSTLDQLVGLSMPANGGSIASEVFRTGRAIFLDDPATSEMTRRSVVERTGTRAVYLAPVRSGSTVTAVLAVGWTALVDDIDDRRAGVVCLLADQAGVALRQASLVSELETLALTDALTGLPNRRGWDQHLSHLLAMSRRDGLPVTVAIADLDHFKLYNDAFGHQAGDELLQEFAQATRRTMRASDSMARWGGEEFAISLPHCGPGEAVAVLNRLRGLTPYGQTCSVGFATWDGSESGEELLARADQALYRAKAEGRDRICSAEG